MGQFHCNKLGAVLGIVFLLLISGVAVLPILIWPPSAIEKRDHNVITPVSERQLVEPIVRVINVVPVPRNSQTGMPFFINIFYTINGNKPLTDVKIWGRLVLWSGQMPSDDVDNNFLAIDTVLDIDKRVKEFSPNTNHFSSVFADALTDHDIETIEKGDKHLYLFIAWEYKFGNEATTYISEYCRYFLGTLENTQVCPGKHNSTFIRRADPLVSAHDELPTAR